jgi:UDP-N-acetylglucosamine:LPS N-acetylglucosamine transferase
VPDRPVRALVLSASIGEGHDLPARLLAEDLAARGVHVEVADGLHAMGPLVERVVMGGSQFESRIGNLAYDATSFLYSRVPPLSRLAGRLLQTFGARGLRDLIAQKRPHVIVSTYPGVTEVLGRLRRRGRLDVPVVSAITDLAALRYWASPGVDVHLIIHPESAAEVRAIAGPQTRIVTVRGLSDPRFAVPRDRGAARAALDLPTDGPIAVVSGGGWGVGDIEGAVEAALAAPGAPVVVVLCGRNAALLQRVNARFAGQPRVRPWGFTTEIPDLFAAADVLVHSTAGLTVLEAWVRGCVPISYGWGRGHIRANNRAYAEHGLAYVARDRAELARDLEQALRTPWPPQADYGALPLAADVVLECVGDRR